MNPLEQSPGVIGRLLARLRWRALMVATAYALFATLWVLFSDQVLGLLVSDPQRLVRLSVYKGLGFVGVTSILLVLLMRRAFGAMELGYGLLQRQEAEIRRLNRLNAAHSHINQAIVRLPDRKELFSRVCEVLVADGGFRLAWIGWRNPATEQLEPVAAAGDEDDYVRRIQVYADDRPEGRGPSGRAFRSGQPYICNNMLEDPVALSWRVEGARRGLRASVALPIRQGEAVAGVLCVYSDEKDFFQDKEMALLQETAADVSFALENLAREEARRTAAERAGAERRFSTTMIESMPGVLYFYDLEGRFLRWNRNLEAVTGYSAAEISGMHPLDFFAPEARPAVEARIAEVFAGGESSVEAPFRAKNGRETPYFFTGRRVEFDGRPCLVGVGIDLTARKRAEEALHEAQGRLQVVVENLQEGLIIAEPTGDFLHWNPAALRLLGFTDLAEGRRHQREFSGIFELLTLDGVPIPPGDWPLARIRRGDTLVGFEVRLRRRGTDWERIMCYTGSQVDYADGRRLAFMTLQDITERKRVERQLRSMNEVLERNVAERTSELQAALLRAEAADRIKSAFLATMSHELRTPLNSIIGFTGIMLQGLAGALNEEQTRQLGMVRGSARHLLELINDVLDISKIEAGQLEVRAATFDLPESIAHVIGLVRPLAEKRGLAVRVEVDPALGSLTSDRRRCEQILLNLLSNAIKFTERGTVTLTACPEPAHRFPGGTGTRPGLRIAVADTGLGIRPTDLASLFQPFRQVDTGLSRQHEGTGLGLAICRRLATLLGGEIIAASEWGRGSEFTLFLPLQPSSPS